MRDKDEGEGKGREREGGGRAGRKGTNFISSRGDFPAIASTQTEVFVYKIYSQSYNLGKLCQSQTEKNESRTTVYNRTDI